MKIFKVIRKIFIKFYNNFCKPPLIKKNNLIIISRSEHNISRKNINKNVLKVLYTLKNNGYQSYLVGGSVRDLLLQLNPKDFDVVTNASPEKIKKLFKNGHIIGKRFQLVHVCFEKHVVEVATFRAHHQGFFSKEGMILRDNVYGTIEEDVVRRDFTINALYYNISDFTIVDYVGGIKDLFNKKLRLIGDPEVRYREDPVRMLRAVRFAAKLGFILDPDTEKPLFYLGELLLNVSHLRLYDEYIKLFFTGHPIESYQLLKHYKLLNILFPSINQLLYSSGNKYIKNLDSFIMRALHGIINKKHDYKEFTPAYLIAVFLWYSVVEQVKLEIFEVNNNNKNNIEEKKSEFVIYKKITEQVLIKQNKIISLSRKIIVCIKDIWLLQIKLAKLTAKPGKRADKLIASYKFNMAFEFMQLRALSADKKAQKIVKWWCKYLATKGGLN